MPVGGSVSASSLNKAAGGRTRHSLVIAGVVMAVIIVALVIAGSGCDAGARRAADRRRFPDDRPADFSSVWRTGGVQKVVLLTTFVLTMIIPIEYAVLIGVGLSVLLYVAGQSNKVTIRRRVPTADGHMVETSRPPCSPRTRWSSSSRTAHVLRGGSDVRRLPATPDAPIAKFHRDPASARTQRHRLDLHRSSSPIRGNLHDRRVEARHRVGE